MADRTTYDAAIVGASVAGCTAATLLARQGLRVALVERHSDPTAFKRVCGHFIQPGGAATLERLGILGYLERAGGFRGRARVWSRYGWIERANVPGREAHASLSIRREVLDPALRRLAADTPGVDLLMGHTLERLEADDSGARGLVLRRKGKDPVRLAARLVVGADGRKSKTAALAGLRTRTSRNDRFGYWGYFEGPPLGTGASVHLWFLEPDVAIVTPTDGGLMLYVAFPERARVPEFKHDPERALRTFIGALPDAPPIAESRLVSPMIGKLDLTNERRRPAGRGIALVGDAALAADPVAAIGCGWALQSAEWLAETVAPALLEEEPLAKALRAYRRRHRRELLGHSLVVDASSRARRLTPVQRLIFSAAVRDPAVAARTEAFASRLIGPRELLAPRWLLRSARVSLSRKPASQPARASTAF
jgi:menaquinone-9 beta-reductase